MLVFFGVLAVVIGIALVLNALLLRRVIDSLRAHHSQLIARCDVLLTDVRSEWKNLSDATHAVVDFTRELSKVTNDVLNNKR